jgi:hypothetical protein
MVEVIRSKTRKAGPRKAWEFALEFYRGDEPVQHQFKAYPSMDAGSLNLTLSATRHPEKAVEGMVRTIRKMLADDDGTPAEYRPRRYNPPPPDEVDEDGPEPDGDLPAGWEQAAREGWEQNPAARAEGLTAPDVEDDEEPDLEDPDLMFLGPDNAPATGEQVAKALEFDAGSSRRRFAYLMDEDESLTLELDQLQTVYKKLLGQVANRPTRR